MESWILISKMKIQGFFAQTSNFVPNCSYYENIEEWARFNQFITSGSLISKTRFFVWSSHIGRMINGSKSICLLCNSSSGKTLMQDIYLCRFCEENGVEIFECIDILIWFLTVGLAYFDLVLFWSDALTTYENIIHSIGKSV